MKLHPLKRKKSLNGNFGNRKFEHGYVMKFCSFFSESTELEGNFTKKERAWAKVVQGYFERDVQSKRSTCQLNFATRCVWNFIENCRAARRGWVQNYFREEILRSSMIGSFFCVSSGISSCWCSSCFGSSWCSKSSTRIQTEASCSSQPRK